MGRMGLRGLIGLMGLVGLMRLMGLIIYYNVRARGIEGNREQSRAIEGNRGNIENKRIEGNRGNKENERFGAIRENRWQSSALVKLGCRKNFFGDSTFFFFAPLSPG